MKTRAKGSRSKLRYRHQVRSRLLELGSLPRATSCDLVVLILWQVYDAAGPFFVSEVGR